MKLKHEHVTFLSARKYCFRESIDKAIHQLSVEFGLKWSQARRICQAFYEQFIEQKQPVIVDKTEDEIKGVPLNLRGIVRQMVEVKPINIEQLPDNKLRVTYPSRVNLKEE
jgi:hypothetical protein